MYCLRFEIYQKLDRLIALYEIYQKLDRLIALYEIYQKLDRLMALCIASGLKYIRSWIG